jgi:hypothetical protein
MSPDAPPPRLVTGAGGKVEQGSSDTPHGTAGPPLPSRTLILHREPEVAALLAVEALGPMGARQFAQRLLAELEGRRS